MSSNYLHIFVLAYILACLWQPCQCLEKKFRAEVTKRSSFDEEDEDQGVDHAAAPLPACFACEEAENDRADRPDASGALLPAAETVEAQEVSAVDEATPPLVVGEETAEVEGAGEAAVSADAEEAADVGNSSAAASSRATVAAVADTEVTAGGESTQGASVPEVPKETAAPPFSAEPPGAAPYMLNLSRVSTPVTRKGKVVSFKTSYAGTVHVGYPEPQEFSVVFDTGSGHVILPSSSCNSSTCLKHERFRVNESETAEYVTTSGALETRPEGREQVTIGFGTGQVVGHLVRERVCIGTRYQPDESTSDPGPCIMSNNIMAFELSENPFAVLAFDGIVGLGLPGLALRDSFSFFDLLSESGQIDSAQFGVFLTEGEDGEVSEIAFGGYNAAKIASPIEWSRVVKRHMGYWQVLIVGVYVDGVRLDVCDDGDCRAVADTGTSHLGVPAPFNQELDAMLRQDADDFLDCRLIDGPTLQLELQGGFNLTLRPENYMRRLPIRSDVMIGGSVGPFKPPSKQPAKDSIDEGEGSQSGQPHLLYRGQWHLASPRTTIEMEVELRSPSEGRWYALGQAYNITVTRDDEGKIFFQEVGGATNFEGSIREGGVIQGIAIQEGMLAGNFTFYPLRREVTGYKGKFASEFATGVDFDLDVRLDAGSEERGVMEIMGELRPVSVSTSFGTISITEDGGPLRLAGSLGAGGVITGDMFHDSVRGGNFTLSPTILEDGAAPPAPKAAAAAPSPGAGEEESPVNDTGPAEAPVQRHCRPRTMPVRIAPPLGPKLWILGEPVLHRYYTVFDWSTPMVGFALARSAQHQRGGVLKPGDDPKGVLPAGMDVYLLQENLEVDAGAAPAP